MRGQFIQGVIGSALLRKVVDACPLDDAGQTILMKVGQRTRLSTPARPGGPNGDGGAARL